MAPKATKQISKMGKIAKNVLYILISIPTK